MFIIMHNLNCGGIQEFKSNLIKFFIQEA